MDKLNLQKIFLIIKNSIALFTTKIIDIVTGIFSVALIARYLGAESFGNYTFVIALVGIFIPITYLGLENIAIRELSRNRDERGEYLGSIIVVRWILSFIAAFLTIVVTFFIHPPFLIVAAIITAMFSELIFSSGSIFISVFKASEHMGFETLITSLSRVLFLFFIIVITVYDLGFIFFFISAGIVNLVRALMAMYISKKFIRPIFRIDYHLWKTLLKESYPIGISVILSLITFRIDILLLEFLQNPYEVMLFQAPFSIILQLQILPLAITTALFPMLSRTSASSVESVKLVYQKVFKFIGIIVLPIVIFIFIFSEEIISLIFGKEFIKAVPMLRLLIWTIIPLSAYSFLNYLFISINKQAFVTRAWIISFVVNLSLAFFLIPDYAAIGAGIAADITYLVLCVVLCRDLLREFDQTRVLQGFLKPAMAALLMMLFIYYFKGEGILRQVGLFILGIGIYGMILILLKTFDHDEKDFVKKAFDGLTGLIFKGKV